MPMIRLLYRTAHAPAGVELGQVCEVDDFTAATLISDGAAEPADAKPPVVLELTDAEAAARAAEVEAAARAAAEAEVAAKAAAEAEAAAIAAAEAEARRKRA